MRIRSRLPARPRVWLSLWLWLSLVLCSRKAFSPAIPLKQMPRKSSGKKNGKEEGEWLFDTAGTGGCCGEEAHGIVCARKADSNCSHSNGKSRLPLCDRCCEYYRIECKFHQNQKHGKKRPPTTMTPTGAEVGGGASHISLRSATTNDQLTTVIGALYC